MALFPWQKKEGSENAQVEIPDAVMQQIKDGAEAKEKLNKVEQMLADLTKIQLDDKAAREKEKKAAADALAHQQRQKVTEQTDEQIEELMLTNPREAIRLATQGQTEAIKAVHADNVRREVFEDGEKFKYYTGDLKREIDSLLANQPVDFRLNPANVESTYHTVLGRHTDEIVGGKLKTRFAGGSEGSRGTSSGSAGAGAGGKEKTIVDAETEKEIRRAAKQVGIKYEDYVEMLDKEGVI